MNSIQKIGSAIILTGALGGCTQTPSMKMEGESTDPKSVELFFDSSGLVYAKCVDRVLDAKGYGGAIKSQPRLNVRVPNCTLETIKETLTHFGFSEIADDVPTTKK
ncbi:hypothetical protein KBD33_02030 [Candidatus Gracilibacteria bacterium]|nr:hypothetical protein [Candidatus Gracilibacteria bacterium]